MSGIARVTIEFIPLDNILIPQLTSKVSKTLLLRLLKNARRIIRLVSINEPYKPLALSMIYHKGRYLYGTKKSNRVIYLKKGNRYSFDVTFLSSELIKEMIKVIIKEMPETVQPLYDGKVLIHGISVEYKDFDKISINFENSFKMEFLTPTQFAVKHVSSITRFRLFPIPTLIYLSLVRCWNKYAPKHLSFNEEKLVGRVAVSVFEADWGNLKPVTIIHNKKTVIRGVTGWCIYQIYDEDVQKASQKLLAYAEYVGVGKSRTLGLGRVKITIP